MKAYLPELQISDLMTGLYTGNWSEVDHALAKQEYERLGLERALAIVSDLFIRFGSLQGLHILDVGCNNGLFAKTLAALGCCVVGIDNGDINDQGLYGYLQTESVSRGFEFHQIDLQDFLRSDDRFWDCVLLLSVTHHWETGYAMSGKRRYVDEDIRRIFNTLLQRTKHSIYYECPFNEPGFAPNAGIAFLLRHLADLPRMKLLGQTIGPNGYLRELWNLEVE